MLTQEEQKQLREIREHLANLYERWEKECKDKYCKFNEGYICLKLHYPNWFDSNNNIEEYLSNKGHTIINIYSYLFGPSRYHQFNSIEEAHKAVLSWKYQL